MPHRTSLSTVVPFLPVVAGLALSVLMFRAHDPLLGLASALGGVVLMIVVAIRLPHAER